MLSHQQVKKPTRVPNSRRAALKILSEVRGGRPFEGALDRTVGTLTDADRRQAHELAAGVLRHRSSLDRRLAPLVPRGWHRVPENLRDILRLGAYQLTAMDRVPDHAAVDTSVELAKLSGGVRAAGFVNAVLRRLARSEDPTPSDDTGASALATEYSHPLWLARRWVDRFGVEETEALLHWNNSRPRVVLQAAREDLEQLRTRWHAVGIEVELAPYGAGLITNRSRPADLPGYREGHFMVQDPAQALLARFVDSPAKGSIYDACAAPGGKTIALGRHARTVIAGEVRLSRAKRLAENLARAGSGREHVIVADGRQPPLRSIDLVLVDAPCLGTGTFARHPDARWRVTPQALAHLVRLQAELLESTAQLVAPGGLLVYSTCSLEPEENRGQVDRFLESHPEFSRDPGSTIPPPLLSAEGDLVILPQRHGMDGAYAARLRRSA